MSKSIIPSKYTTPLDESDKKMCINRVSHKDVHDVINDDLNFLDCSRIINDKRIIQTIDHTYKYTITKLIFIINQFIHDESEREIYFNKIRELHKQNINYEKENIPIIYDKKKVKAVKTTTKKVIKEKVVKDKVKNDAKVTRAAFLKTLKFKVSL